MRKIDSIIVHCSATKAGQDFTAADIDRWHRERGFNGIGYHYVIRLDGRLEKGRDISLIGAHCKGWNERSIGICYVGGLNENGQPADTRTNAQKRVLYQVIMDLQREYGILQVLGHRDTSPDLNGDGVIEPYEYVKACPCFDVREFMKSGRELLFILLLAFIIPVLFSGCRCKKEMLNRNSKMEMDSSSLNRYSNEILRDSSFEEKISEKTDECIEYVFLMTEEDSTKEKISPVYLISGVRKVINKTFERKRLLSDKEDTKKEYFMKTGYNKVIERKNESSKWCYKSLVSQALRIVIILLILFLLYLFYKKKMMHI